MNLVHDLIVLRAVEKEDLEVIRNIANDSEIENMVVGWGIPISKTQQEEWYDNIKKNNNKITYAIEYNGDIIGVSMITNIDWKNRNAEIGIKLINNTDYRGKGIATDVVKMMLNYSFKELGFNRIGANILQYNIPSQKLFQKCGFVLEGTKRKCIYKNNKFNDLYMYGILKEEFLGENND